MLILKSDNLESPNGVHMVPDSTKLPGRYPARHVAKRYKRWNSVIFAARALLGVGRHRKCTVITGQVSTSPSDSTNSEAYDWCLFLHYAELRQRCLLRDTVVTIYSEVNEMFTLRATPFNIDGDRTVVVTESK